MTESLQDEDDVTPFSSSSSSTDSSSSSTDSSQFHSSASIRDSMQSLEDESEVRGTVDQGYGRITVEMVPLPVHDQALRPLLRDSVGAL